MKIQSELVASGQPERLCLEMDSLRGVLGLSLDTTSLRRLRPGSRVCYHCRTVTELHTGREIDEKM